MLGRCVTLDHSGHGLRRGQAVHGLRPADTAWMKSRLLWTPFNEGQGSQGDDLKGLAVDYETWVRRLTCALLQRCCSPVLKGLSKLAQLQVFSSVSHEHEHVVM
jgi:hypothetical protein